MTAVIKVDSPRREAYYSLMRPYVHYVPVRADLSDLEAQLRRDPGTGGPDRPLRALVASPQQGGEAWEVFGGGYGIARHSDYAVEERRDGRLVLFDLLPPRRDLGSLPPAAQAERLAQLLRHPPSSAAFERTFQAVGRLSTLGADGAPHVLFSAAGSILRKAR